MVYQWSFSICSCFVIFIDFVECNWVHWHFNLCLIDFNMIHWLLIFCTFALTFLMKVLSFVDYWCSSCRSHYDYPDFIWSRRFPFRAAYIVSFYCIGHIIWIRNEASISSRTHLLRLCLPARSSHTCAVNQLLERLNILVAQHEIQLIRWILWLSAYHTRQHSIDWASSDGNSAPHVIVLISNFNHISILFGSSGHSWFLLKSGKLCRNFVDETLESCVYRYPRIIHSQ